MKRYKIAILRRCLAAALCALATSAVAQDAAACFVALPDAQCPLLDKAARTALVNPSADTVTNALGGTARRDTLTATYLSVRPTAVSRIEVMLLPDAATGGQCAAIIETVTAPADDSRITFVTPAGQSLAAAGRFVAPTLRDFLTAEADSSEVARWLVPFIVGIHGTADGTLVATIHPESYLPVEYYDKIKNALSAAPVTYRWDGHSFVNRP